MDWQTFPHLIPYLISLAISTTVGIFALRRRDVRGAAAFAVVALAEASMTLGYVFELANPGLEGKVFWDNFQWVGALVVPMAFLSFALQYAGRQLSHPRRTWGLLAVVPVISLVLVFTNSLHGLFWPRAWPVPGEPFAELAYDFTPLVWIIAIYTYALSLSGVYVLFSELVRPQRLYRSQIGTVVIGFLTPVAGSILTVAGVRFTFHRDITLLTFALGNLVVAWGLFRYHLFDIVPVARRVVIENMPDPIVVFDPRNRLVDLNPAAERSIGRSAAEVIGQPAAQVYSEWSGLVEQLQDIEEAHTELAVPDKEGSTRHVDLTISPVRDRRGRPTGRLIIVRDITDRVRAEEALRESEGKYRRLVESTVDWVWAVDVEGRHTFSNKAIETILGHTADEIVGTSAFPLIHPGDRERIQEMFQRSVEQKVGWTDVAIRWLHKDGSIRFCESSAQPILDADGRLAGFSGIDRDITARVRAEQELEKHRVQLEQMVEERTAELQIANEQLRQEITDRKQAEQALYDSEAKLHAIVEHATDSIYIKDGDGRYLLVNPAGAALFGLAPEEIIGRQDIDLYGSEDARQIREIDRRVMDSGEPYAHESHRVFDGVDRFFLTVKFPYVSREGELLGIIGISREITVRKQAEQALHESEKLLRHVIDTTPAHIFVKDRDGKFVLVNRQMAERHATTVEDMIGKTELEFTQGAGSADEIRAFMADDREVIDTGQPKFIPEEPFTLPDGAVRWLQTTKVPLAMRDIPNCVMGVSIDITERKRAKEALEQRQRELESLLDISRDLLSTLDLDSLLSLIARRALNLLAADDCALFRLEADGVTLCPILAIGPYQDRFMSTTFTVGEGLTGHALAANQPILVNDAQRDPRALVLFEPLILSRVHLLAAPLASRERIIGAMLVNRHADQPFTDSNLELFVGLAQQAAIAIENAQLYEQGQRHAAELEARVAARTVELQAANQRLEALSRVKDEFVSNVSHELRTPITSLKLYHELLSRKPGDYEKYGVRAQREIDRLARIVDDLLRLSRLDQERVVFRPEPTDLNTLTAQYVTDRTPLAESRQITLVHEEMPDLPPVDADRGLLGQALSILLTNALNFTPAGGAVTVTTRILETKGERWAGFSVTDNGPGISPEDQTHLFERFFRGKVGRESGMPGTGLGLAIAKEIVERHNGWIGVESENLPGKGATFTVWLPANEAGRS